YPEGKPGDKSAGKTEDEKKEGEKKEGENKEGDTKAESKPDNSLKESTADGVAILVGDSDMIFDPVCAQVQNIFGQKIVIPNNSRRWPNSGRRRPRRKRSSNRCGKICGRTSIHWKTG